MPRELWYFIFLAIGAAGGFVAGAAWANGAI